MKAFFGAAILAAAIVGGVVWKAVGASSAQADRQEALAAQSTVVLDEILSRLAQVEDRIESLETEAAATRRIAAPSAAGELSAAAGAEESSSSKKPAADLPRLKGMNEADVEDLRALIAEVYLEERNNRRQREKEEAEAAAREREEMMQGPYGEHNYRVNSLGKKLGLSDYQKSRYHELLAAHHQRLREMRKGLNISDAAARESWNDRRRSLNDDFQTTVVSLLSADQAAAYEALDEGEKSAGEEAMMKFTRALHLGAGGEVKLDVITGGAIEPMPVAPEMLKAAGGGGIRLPAGEAGEVIIEQHVGVGPDGGEQVKGRVFEVKPAR